MTMPSATARILIGLVLGLIVGTLIGAAGPGRGAGLLAVVLPVGHLWLQGLQMTVVPLVFALVVTGTAAVAGQAALGGVPARAIALFAVLLVAGSAFGLLVTMLIIDLVPPTASGLAALRAGVSGPPPQAPELGAWLTSFVPANPVAAAADSQMVGLVVFALIFGFATARLAPDLRDRLIGLFDAIAEAMLVVVGWVLLLAPIGVFALAIGVGAGAGAAAAGALVHYVLVVVAVLIALLAATYLLVALWGRNLGRFAREAVPAQVVAFGTQSSIATLPAMLATADRIGVREAVRDTVLPMAVSLFRITSPCANIAVAYYVATVYGLSPGFGTLVATVLVAALVSLSAVGLPGQVSFITSLAPICLTLHAPLGVLPLMLAVESIPDIFRTVGNVTGDLAVTDIVDARTPRQG